MVDVMVMTDRELDALRALVDDIRKAEARKRKMVEKLRERGATWTEIGFALGITAQGAQKVYGLGPEREQAHREQAAANAIKRRTKAAKKAAGS